MEDPIKLNGKQVYKIDIPGNKGYSLAIATDYEPITAAMELDLFDDMRDAQYAQVEEMSQEDYKFWEKYVVEH